MTIQPEVTVERTAMIVFLLCEGRRFRTAEVARLLGLTRQGAYAHLSRVSRVVPLATEGGEWFLVRQNDDASNSV